MMRVSFQLTGITPLLFHADDIELNDGLTEWQKAPENKNQSKKGDDRTPPWTWQTYLYSDGVNLAWPSANIMVGLRQAGARIILNKQKTYKELTQSGIQIQTEFCTFRNGKGDSIPMKAIVAMREKLFRDQCELVKPLGFKLYAKRARVGQAKHIRVRARFETWSVSGELEVTTPDLNFATLEQIFEFAGQGGQGDWRPACKTPGPFGRFTPKLKLMK